MCGLHGHWCQCIVAIISALAWPAVVLIAICTFHKSIRDLLGRIVKVKAAGVEAELQRQKERIDAPPTAEEARLSSQVQSGKIANMYWLGHDLMWLIVLLLNGADRGWIVWQLEHANFHLKIIGLEGTSIQQRLERLLRNAETTQATDWTSKVRAEYAENIKSIALEIGKIVEAAQPNFEGSPKR